MIDKSANRKAREHAGAQGLRKYMSPEPCLRGHMSERYTSTGNCIACLKVHRVPETAKFENVFICWPIGVPPGIKTEPVLKLLNASVKAHVDTTIKDWLREWGKDDASYLDALRFYGEG